MLESFKTFSDWYSRLEVPHSSRQGIPKGRKIPIAGRKFKAAALMILFPKGLKSTAELAKVANTTGGTVRNWRVEPAFKSLICEHEDAFAAFVLKSLPSPGFLKRFSLSLGEMKFWSNRVLLTFGLNIHDNLGENSEKSLWRIHLKERPKQRVETSLGTLLDQLKIPRIELETPNDPTTRRMWKGLADNAFLADLSGKSVTRGRIPKGRQENPTTQRMFGYAMILKDYLDEIERGIDLGRTKSGLKGLLDYANANLLELFELLKEGT